MNVERYTNKVKTAIQNAQMKALANGNTQILSEHLLLAFFEDDLVDKIIATAGGNSQFIEEKISEFIERQPRVSGSGAGQPTLSADLARVLQKSEKLADKNKDSFITIERVLQAMLEENSNISNIFRQGGVNINALNQAINQMRAGKTADTDDAENNFQALEKFTKDITRKKCITIETCINIKAIRQDLENHQIIRKFGL